MSGANGALRSRPEYPSLTCYASGSAWAPLSSARCYRADRREDRSGTGVQELDVNLAPPPLKAVEQAVPEPDAGGYKPGREEVTLQVASARSGHDPGRARGQQLGRDRPAKEWSAVAWYELDVPSWCWS
jgi:hypothetical protein